MRQFYHQIYWFQHTNTTCYDACNEFLFDRTAINDYVMELLIMAYACKTSSANRIIGKEYYSNSCTSISK